MGKSLKIGDRLVDFCLNDQNRELCCTKEFRGHFLILYFYPKDDTRICTVEACSFNDHLSLFKDLNAVVMGISSDSVESHSSFHSKYNLDFKLLSDEGSKIRKQFAAYHFFGLLPARITYLIDREGFVLAVIKHIYNAKTHVQLSLKKLKELQSSGS